MRPTDALPHPPDWNTTTVGAAVEVKRGISWSKEQEHQVPRDGALPVIRIGNVQSTLELDDILYVSDLKPKDVDMKRVAAEWSVMVGSNGNRRRIGNAVLVDKDTDYLFASFLIAAKPRPESGINPRYFSRWLRTEQVQAYLTASAEGSTGLCNLSHSFFQSMAIPFPRPDEQIAIANVLDAMDRVIELTRIAQLASRHLQYSLIDDALDGLVSTQRKLGDFANDIRYGTSEASSERGWGNPVLRIPNVVGDQLALNDLAYVDLRSIDVDRLKLVNGDLLLVRTNGNPNYIGRSAVFRVPDSRIWGLYSLSSGS